MVATNIYFTTDTKRIYKGADLYSNEIALVTEKPLASATQTDKLYIVKSTGDMYVNIDGVVTSVGMDTVKTAAI